MEKQLITLENESIYNKIKNFFYKILHRNSVNETTIENNKTINFDIEKEGFINDIKVDADMSEITKKLELEEFLKKLEEDDTILDNLSLYRLKILEKFYEDRIERKKEILKK